MLTSQLPPAQWCDQIGDTRMMAEVISFVERKMLTRSAFARHPDESDHCP